MDGNYKNTNKIVFHIGDPIICGGILVPCQQIGELRRRGYDAWGIATRQDAELEKYMGIPFKTEGSLGNLTDNDIIIAVRWEFCERLEKYKGKKYQLVQGRDMDVDCGEDWKKEMSKWRNSKNWELIGVSEFCLKDWRRGTVVPNGINDRFFVNHGLERDIDALVEGTPEPNKNVAYAIEQARKDGHQRIVWLGRETTNKYGVETITNPPQEEIPKIYQRAKHFYKYSKSEGFCLPIVEAKASGCIIHTWDQGHNFPEDFDPREYTWDKAVEKLLAVIHS